jgi:plasmid maintenance system killer protein
VYENSIILVIDYATTKIRKLLTSEIAMQKKYGDRRARTLMLRLHALHSATVLAHFAPYSRPERCHELIGNRAGQLAMDVDKGTRLIFRPSAHPIPRRADGGMDWSAIDAVTIIEVEDYHE